MVQWAFFYDLCIICDSFFSLLFLALVLIFWFGANESHHTMTLQMFAWQWQFSWDRHACALSLAHKHAWTLAFHTISALCWNRIRSDVRGGRGEREPFVFHTHTTKLPLRFVTVCSIFVCLFVKIKYVQMCICVRTKRNKARKKSTCLICFNHWSGSATLPHKNLWENYAFKPGQNHNPSDKKKCDVDNDAFSMYLKFRCMSINFCIFRIVSSEHNTISKYYMERVTAKLRFLFDTFCFSMCRSDIEQTIER